MVYTINKICKSHKNIFKGYVIVAAEKFCRKQLLSVWQRKYPAVNLHITIDFSIIYEINIL